MKGAIFTFIAAIVIEAYIGVSLDKFYSLNLVFQAVNNTFIPLMPTTGPFVQSAGTIALFASFVHIILRLMPSILLAAGAYWLISDMPDEY